MPLRKKHVAYICLQAFHGEHWYIFCSNLENLKYFKKLETLILDKNDLEGLRGFPPMSSVTTLWFNNNKVRLLPLTVFRMRI
jgi:hypothetical protein